MEGFNRHLGKTIAIMMNKASVDVLSRQRRENAGTQEKQSVCDALEVAACLIPALLMACFESAEGVCRIKKQTATPTRMPLRKDQAKWVRWEPGCGQTGVMLHLHCARKTFHLESRKTEKGWKEAAKRQVLEGAQGLGKVRTGLYANNCSRAPLDLQTKDLWVLCEGQVKEVKASSYSFSDISSLLGTAIEKLLSWRRFLTDGVPPFPFKSWQCQLLELVLMWGVYCLCQVWRYTT